MIKDGLRPCPFCGQPGVIEKIAETNQFYPRCTGGSDSFCLLTRRPDPKEDGFVKMSDAVEVWNRRPAKKPKTKLPTKFTFKK